jgi:hypothetical protein
MQMSELSIIELEAQHSEFLPEREALGHWGGVNIVAFNTAAAVQALTFLSANAAVANQVIFVG